MKTIKFIDQQFLLTALMLEPVSRQKIYPVILIDYDKRLSSVYVMVHRFRRISHNKYEVIT